MIFGSEVASFDWNSFSARHRGPARGEWIARHHEIVSDRSALDVTLRTPRSIGKTFPFLYPSSAGSL